MNARRGKPRIAVAVALFWAALFVVAAELLLRWSCNYCTWMEQNGNRWESPYRIDETTPYLLREPSTVSRYGQPEFDYELRTNSLGLRDIEHPLAKATGEFRVLAVGDSFTEGQGAPFDETWTAVLGRALNRAGDGLSYRVMVGGVAGSDPFYAARLLQDRLLDYQPDLVLMVVNFSDVTDVITRGGEERYAIDGRTSPISDPPTGLPVCLFEHSHLFRFVIMEAFGYTHLLITRDERRIKAEAAREKIAALAVRVDRLLAERGIRFVLVAMPGGNELERGAYDDLQDLPALLAAARAGGVSTIDVKSYFDARLAGGEAPLGDLVWELDRHYTPLGYRYFGAAVLEGLCTVEGALPAAAVARHCPPVP